MKRNYRLNGLDCANCASKLESTIAKIEGVDSVTISFMTLKMIVEIDEKIFDNVMEKVLEVIKKFEPDIVVKRC